MDILNDSNITEYLDEKNPDFGKVCSNLGKFLFAGLSRAFTANNKVRKDHLEEFSQEALIKIIANKESFSGKSRFTTWAMKIAVNLVLSEIRKKEWENVSLESFDRGESFFESESKTRLFFNPERTAMRNDMINMVNGLIKTILSDRQKTAMIYHLKFNMPLDEIARRTGSNRNAVYKLLHDSRKVLKKQMMVMGIDSQDISEVQI